MMDFSSIIGLVNVLLFVILLFLGYVFRELPKFIAKFYLEKFNSDSQISLQTKAYFRDISSQDLRKTFESWLTLITEMSESKVLKDKDLLLELQAKTIMYGSERTIKILAEFMQHIYSGNTTQEGIAKTMVYICYLVSSLKEDFTGYKIEPLSLLRIRINDFNSENEQILKEVEKEIKEKIR